VRIFVFESQTRQGLNAFAGDIAGSRLPERVGPWRLISGSPSGSALIERAIGSTGFQLWRLKDTAVAK